MGMLVKGELCHLFQKFKIKQVGRITNGDILDRIIEKRTLWENLTQLIAYKL